MADSPAPLRCSACNAPLVLGDTDTIACPACGVLTPVPETYRELVRARVDDVQLHAEAQAALRHLARPAPLIVRILARMFDIPIFVSLIFNGIPIILFAALHAISTADAYQKRHHLSNDAVTPTLILLFETLGILLAFAFVPRALGVFANRRTADRAKILAALAAHPPHTPGGAASCRGCGAPLIVAPDALVATCVYCKVQSVVQMPASIAELAQSQVATLATTLHAAVELDRKEGRATLRKLGSELWRYTSRALLLAGVLCLGFVSTAASAIAGILFAGWLFYRASVDHDDDAASRRSVNNVPGVVAVLGPILVWTAFEYFPSWFGM